MHDWSYGTINFTAWFPHNTCNANATLKAMGHLDHILGSKFVNHMLKLLGHWSSSPYVLQGWFISHGRFSWTLFSFQLVAMLWSFHVWYRQKKLWHWARGLVNQFFNHLGTWKLLRFHFHWSYSQIVCLAITQKRKKKKKLCFGEFGLE